MDIRKEDNFMAFLNETADECQDPVTYLNGQAILLPEKDMLLKCERQRFVALIKRKQSC
jgi:hypothetical protein